MKRLKLFTNPRLVFRKEEDGAFLFDPDTGNLNCLNQTGAFIWEMCSSSKGTFREEIFIHMTRNFSDIPEDSLSRDIERFLKELRELEFIIERE